MPRAHVPGEHAVVVVDLIPRGYMASCWCGWDTHPHRYETYAKAARYASAHAKEVGIEWNPFGNESDPADVTILQHPTDQPTKEPTNMATNPNADPKKSAAAVKAAATRAANRAAKAAAEGVDTSYGAHVTNVRTNPGRVTAKDKAAKESKAFKAPAAAPVTSKVCPGCKTEKPVEAFVKNAARKDGLSRLCRTCDAEYSKAYRAAKKAQAAAKNREPVAS